MKKRLLSGLLCAVLIMGLLPVAMAATPTEDECAMVLSALDIMVGDRDGNLNLNHSVTRAEFTKLAVAATPNRDSVGDTVAVKPYPDVPQHNWAAPWVKTAVDMGLVEGDLQGNFNPSRRITLAEGVTMVLRLLGYEDSEFTNAWPTGQMAQYRALKLNRGLDINQNSWMSRRDAMYLIYNLMTTKTTTGQYYLNMIDPTQVLVGATGEIDQVALINSVTEGPVVAAAGLENTVPFPLNDDVKVYREGKLADLNAIQPNDVVYWSKTMRSLWAHTGQATGTYEKASPSASAPTAITVAGKSYSIETPAAALALSDLGQWKVGDSVTLLLGRDGGIVAVVAPQSTGILVYGVVTALASAAYDSGAGDSYTAATATITATDGLTYSYQVNDKNLKVGDMVRVSTENGTVQVKRQSTSNLTGRVNGDATKISAYVLASDVQILDTYKDAAPLRVYPARLAGVDLADDMVRFFATNTAGEISHLILNDVTGDLFQYGVITEVIEVSGGLMINSAYHYDLAGTARIFGPLNTIYNLKEEPCQIKTTAAGVERLYNLTSAILENIDGNSAISNQNRKYTLSDTVVVYQLDQNGDYHLSSLARITGKGYAITGWYENEAADGGRIRVIIAKEPKA